MKVVDRILVPEGCKYIEIVFEGSGNPSDEHKIVGVIIGNLTIGEKL